MKRHQNGTPKIPVRSTPITNAKRQRMWAIAAAAAGLYVERGRNFPWRNESNPYRLAVAEILLQKTRAENVVGTYLTLLERYPNASALASAELDHLETALRPLGLSRKRAEQLKGMASAVISYTPSDFSNWRRMLAEVPGLGAYAARAISCFARGEVVGIVDANVARIVRRAFSLKTSDARATVFQQYADAIAGGSDDVRATNFGLLDIGALICLSSPRCQTCPMRQACDYGRKMIRMSGPRK